MSFFGFAESISLVPNGTLFFHIFIICVMIYVLNRTFFKPINEILARRETRTRVSGAGSAGDLLQQVEEKTQHYEASLRAARSEGYRHIEQERNEAVAARQQQIGEVKAQISQLAEAQKATIAAQVAESRATLQTEAQRIAQEISTRILGRAING